MLYANEVLFRRKIVCTCPFGYQLSPQIVDELALRLDELLHFMVSRLVVGDLGRQSLL